MTRSHPLRLIMATVASGALAAACSHKPPPPVDTGPPPPPPPAGMPPAPLASDSGMVNGAPLGQAAPGSEQDFAQNAGDRIYFAYDQYAVTPEAGAVLDRQVAWLQRYPAVTVRIEGNADERGTREYNIALSGRRADALKGYLVQHGVEGGRVSTISYGKERPIDTSGTEEGMAKNRNGHTAITGGAR